jgi:hypothetical protein
MPRGTNNRVDEQNTNRNNNNRLFDSQNNNKGGYTVGVDEDDYTDGVRPLHSAPCPAPWLVLKPMCARVRRVHRCPRRVRSATGTRQKASR